MCPEPAETHGGALMLTESRVSQILAKARGRLAPKVAA